MRVSLLISFFAGLSAVNAFPAKDKDNSACTCIEKVKETTTIYDRTKSIKATISKTTTLDPETKTDKVTITTTAPYTATYHAITSETLTSTSTIIETAPFFANNAKVCKCPFTTTQTQLKTEHGTITVLIPKTKLEKVVPKPTTVTSTKVKSVKSAVQTEVVVSTRYFSANATTTTTAPYAFGNATTVTSTMTGTGGVVIVTSS